MNICFFITDNSLNGGAIRVTKLISNALAMNHNVYIVALSNSSTTDNCLTAEVLMDKRSSLRKIFFKAVGKLRKFIKAHDIDIVISVVELLSPVCYLAIKGLKTRHISWSHNYAAQSSEFAFHKQCAMISARTADCVINLTNESRDYFMNVYHAKNAIVIPNPIDPVLISKNSYAIESKRIISVGRLCHVKNFEQLVDVAALVLNKHPEWSWDIYGEGEKRTVIQEKIESCGLVGKVNLVGAVSDIYDRYSDYAMLVMTSRSEGFPMVLLEGMAKGLPLIAFDVKTGPNQIISEGKNGYLIEPFDVEDMANKICYLMENTSVRTEMSEANYELRSKYTIESVIEKWEDVLKAVHANKNATASR